MFSYSQEDWKFIGVDFFIQLNQRQYRIFNQILPKYQISSDQNKAKSSISFGSIPFVKVIVYLTRQFSFAPPWGNTLTLKYSEYHFISHL